MEESIEAKDGMSAMDALKRKAAVETSFGGNFIQSINGAKSEFSSGTKKDWFFFVNGFSPNFSANNYILKAGDKLQFDFHDWSYQLHIPAFVGGFPEPLVNGFQGKTFPAMIVFGQEFEQEAQKIRAFLKQNYSIDSELAEFSQLSEMQKKQFNLVLIALPENPLIQEINSNHKRHGLFLFFENNKLVELNFSGERLNEFENASVFFAVASPWNDKGILAQENIVFVFSATNNESLKKGTQAFLKNPNMIQNSFSAIFSENEFKKVPA